MRVLLWKDVMSDGQLIWLAQSIDEDMASQGAPGDSDPLAVIEDLGYMFDARDAWMVEHSEDRIEQLPEAPEEFAAAWMEGDELGLYALGLRRRADVRVCREGVDPYRNWKANRDAERAAKAP